jgi:hypothetical protein
MASHRREELKDAAETVTDAALAAGFDPDAVVFEDELDGPVDPEPFELGAAPFEPASSQIFDVEAVDGLAA